MRRNRIMRSANNLYSRKHKKVGYWALCVLGTAAAFYMACALKLPARAAGPSSQEPQVELHVEEVTQGEQYDELVSKLTQGEGEPIAPPQVMELTATVDGKEMPLTAGLTITMQVDPSPALLNTALEDGVSAAGLEDGGGDGTDPGIVVKVLSSGGEHMEQIFTREEVRGGQLSPLTITCTVPEDGSAMYAVAAYAANIDTIKLERDESWDTDDKLTIDKDTTIDLNGYTITCTGNIKVKEGVILTIMDSSEAETGCINNAHIDFDDGNGGTLNLKGGTLNGNGNGYVIYAAKNSTVNMSGGTITGGNNWAGGGIYAENGAVNISGGTIEGNTASGSGGGIYMESGTVNISGKAVIRNNTAENYGGGVCCGLSWGSPIENGGKVVMSEGTISGNKVTTGSTLGGGVSAKTMELSGGTISGNTSVWRGGGVYAAETMTMTGGTISGNVAEHPEFPGSLDSYGGGVWAQKMYLRGGTIEENRTQLGGGGVYTTSMMMTGGTIQKNTVQGEASIWNAATGKSDRATGGGGGIYIAAGTPVFNDGGETTHGIYNMSVTGGTISENESNFVGGGIFVGKGAIAHVRGTNGNTVEIKGNKANDTHYDYVSENDGHGFAGGGIFVEHTNNKHGLDSKTDGGQLYLYNAVVTGNEAWYGGGVGGCGASRIIISRSSGIAVYDNKLTEGKYRPYDNLTSSKDIYSDGTGVVDSVMPGGGDVVWEGWKARDELANPQKLDPVTPNPAVPVTDYTYGFYLNATGVTEAEKAAARGAATVFIEGNYSGSGGGGIGGNGYMELGFDPPRPETLVLRKVVSGPDDGTQFHFTIQLKYSNGSSYDAELHPTLTDRAGNSRSDLLDIKGGTISCYLQNGYQITIPGLPKALTYEIEEDPTAGYTSIVQVNDGEKNYTDTASGTVGEKGSIVIFTNKSSYELPSTGDAATAVYIGGALLIAAAVGLLIYKKCAGKRSGRQ